MNKAKSHLRFGEWCKINATKNLNHIGVIYLAIDDMDSLYAGYQAYIKAQDQLPDDSIKMGKRMIKTIEPINFGDYTDGTFDASVRCCRALSIKELDESYEGYQDYLKRLEGQLPYSWKTMELSYAITMLKKHNELRYSGKGQIEPQTQLGVAIDIIIKYIEGLTQHIE